jgi:hypothetical protein
MTGDKVTHLLLHRASTALPCPVRRLGLALHMQGGWYGDVDEWCSFCLQARFGL